MSMAGINATIKDNNSYLEPLLTKQEIMNHLHIKDDHTFYKLVKQGLPIKKIANKIMVPLNQYNKWLKNL